MSTSLPKTSTPRQRDYQFWIGRLIIIIGLGLLVYYGYCFGLWGKGSVLLQHLFQCSCPRFSEEFRYPGQVDVVVSACRNGGTRLSPSGRLLFVYGKDHPFLSAYLLNLETKNETPLTLPESDIYFLNDELMYIFVWYGRGNQGGEHIFDLRTQRMYPIQKFVFWRPGSFIDGDADPAKLAESLHNAEDVYYVRNGRLIVALPQDFASTPDQAFLSSAFDLPNNGDVNRAEPFLRENNIDYENIPAIFPGEAVSPDGRFIARHDGIYLVENNLKVVDGYKFSWYYRSYSGQYLSLRGWKYDNSGAIYSQFIGPCLLEPPGLDGPGCIWEVPQAVILLKLPEEYLSSTQMP